jgi:hypothetical protein
MKDRDIEENEINKITRLAPTREKAFFTIMRQSGLTPNAIKKLRIKDVEKILETYTPTPCKIRVSHENYPVFIGEEAVNHLKRYLRDKSRRTRPTRESLLFSTRSNPDKEINTKDVSRTFRRILKKLQRNGKIALEIRKGRPNELRLFSLVDFYRRNASDYEKEISSVHEPRNDEFYRDLYEKTAMPYLEIEPLTKNEVYQLKKRLKQIEHLLPEEPRDGYGEWLAEHPEEEARLKKEVQERFENRRKWEEEHPEEDEAEEKEREEFEKAWEEHGTEWRIESLQERIRELERRLDEIGNTTRKPKRSNTRSGKS